MTGKGRVTKQETKVTPPPAKPPSAVDLLVHSPEFRQRLDDAVRCFLPGLYKHYRGGAYVALCLAVHHETRLPMVVYISLTYGSTNVRPIIGWPGDEDGFLDRMPNGNPRFMYVGHLPSSVPALKRVE